MKRTIDISNYEAWLLDSMEGSLSSQEEEQLRDFLARHPELDSDLEGLEDCTLEPQHISNIDKEELLAPSVSELRAMELAESNTPIEIGLDPTLYQTLKKTKLEADEHLVFTDKEKLRMPNAQMLALLDAIDQEGSASNSLSEEETILAQQLSKTILRPNLSLVYPHKEELKHKEHKTPILPIWVQWSSAAAACFLLGLLLFNGERESQYQARSKNPEISFPNLAQEQSLERSRFQENYLEKEPAQEEVKSPQVEQNTQSPAPIKPNTLPPISPAEEPLAQKLDEMPIPIEQATEDTPVPLEDEEQETHPLLAEENSRPIPQEELKETDQEKPSSKVQEYNSIQEFLLSSIEKKAKEAEILTMAENKGGEAAYVRTSLRLGKFEVSLGKRKK